MSKWILGTPIVFFAIWGGAFVLTLQAKSDSIIVNLAVIIRILIEVVAEKLSPFISPLIGTTLYKSSFFFGEPTSAGFICLIIFYLIVTVIVGAILGALFGK